MKNGKEKNGRVKDRAARNKARREQGLQGGDPRHADHIKPLSESNVRKLENLKKDAKRKKK